MLIANIEIAVHAISVFCQLAVQIIESVYQNDEDWEAGGRFIYLEKVGCEFVILSATFSHYLHLFCREGISFSIISIPSFVIGMRLKIIAGKWLKLVNDFQQYRRVMEALDSQFNDASSEELQSIQHEVCAICLRGMSAAKKLPCGHYFHKSCIRQYFECRTASDHKCPICRQVVNLVDRPLERPPSGAIAQYESEENDAFTRDHESNESSTDELLSPARPQLHQLLDDLSSLNDAVGHVPLDEAVFRITCKYSYNWLGNSNVFTDIFCIADQLPSWLRLPAFSFEIIRRQNEHPVANAEANTRDQNTGSSSHNNNNTGSVRQNDDVHSETIEHLIQDQNLGVVKELFPQYPNDILIQDLAQTKSADATIENILMGKLVRRPRRPEGTELNPVIRPFSSAFLIDYLFDLIY